MEKRRVVITGMGAVSPYGLGTERLFSGLKNYESGIKYVPELATVKGITSLVAGLVPDFDSKIIPRKERRSMSPMTVYATIAAKEAIEMSGLPEETIKSGRFGIAAASTVSSVITVEEMFEKYLKEKSIESFKTMSFFKIMAHSLSANLGQVLGCSGRVISPAAACATSTHAIGLGYEAIAFGRQDYMLCGGGEEFHPLTVGTFDVMNAASNKFNNEPSKTPRPFDRDRDGIVASEGAGLILLESIDSAIERKANILAEICGFATCTDTSSIANPSPESIARCMDDCLKDAGITASDVDYINAHGTGTLQGDTAECEGIKKLFGSNIHVSSLKGHIGHTFAASGALELAACVEMLRCGMLFATLNLDNIDKSCDFIIHILSHINKDTKIILKNNFALGGINSSIVIKKW